jgi:hypothetical protein
MNKPIKVLRICILLWKVQLTSEKKNRIFTFLEKNATYGKLVGSYAFFEKSATRIKYKSRLHISGEKCNSYGKLVGGCTFWFKVQLILEISRGCTFLEKVTTYMKN